MPVHPNANDKVGRHRTFALTVASLVVCLMASCSVTAVQPQHTSETLQLGRWTADITVVHVTDSLGNLTCWSRTQCAALGYVNRTGYYVLVRFSPRTDEVYEWTLTGLTTVMGPAGLSCTSSSCFIAADQCEPIDATSGQETTCTPVIARQSEDGPWSIVFRLGNAGGGFSGISCANIKTCVAIGTTPSITGGSRYLPYEVTSIDGGSHWTYSSESQISGSGLAAVACYLPSRCIADSNS